MLSAACDIKCHWLCNNVGISSRQQLALPITMQPIPALLLVVTLMLKHKPHLTNTRIWSRLLWAMSLSEDWHVVLVGGSMG